MTASITQDKPPVKLAAQDTTADAAPRATPH
jgi:hypothetical protein